MIKQCERNRAGYAVADDTDGLLMVPLSNPLHHATQPIDNGNTSLRGDTPFSAGEELYNASEPIGPQPAGKGEFALLAEQEGKVDGKIV